MGVVKVDLDQDNKLYIDGNLAWVNDGAKHQFTIDTPSHISATKINKGMVFVTYDSITLKAEIIGDCITFHAWD